MIKDYTDIVFWNKDMIAVAVNNFVETHSAFYNNYESLVTQSWLGPVMNAKLMTELKPLWLAYADKLQNYYVGNLFTKEDMENHLQWIETIPDWWGKID